ncbi:hypothetical protein ASZ90_015124 [hydrocarbon metagenome]|uniref:Uncharacterized protein n=1 Tax=hydrocarbon metagenome TaxID=938273 RepID=A0A0W8F2U0_9ZZZZ
MPVENIPVYFSANPDHCTPSAGAGRAVRSVELMRGSSLPPCTFLSPR